MCFPKKQSNSALVDTGRATRQASLEAMLRRRRAGAGANVLTGPEGLSNTKLGSAQ